MFISTRVVISVLPYSSQLDSLATKFDCILQRSLTTPTSRVNILRNHFFNHLSIPVKYIFSAFDDEVLAMQR